MKELTDEEISLINRALIIYSVGREEKVGEINAIIRKLKGYPKQEKNEA